MSSPTDPVPSSAPREWRLPVTRTARVWLEGEPQRAAETWILLHGYAQTAAEMASACEALRARERLLVVPEALSRFYRRGSSGPIGASWMTREARELEIDDYVAYLEQLGQRCEHELRAPRPWTLLGFSQGVATLWRWLARGSTPVNRIVSWGAPLPADVELSSVAARLGASRIELVRGSNDGYGTAEALERDLTRLRVAGLDARAHTFEGGHELSPALLSRLASVRTQHGE